MVLAADRFVVVDDFLDDKVEELLGKRRIQIRFDRELAQPGDLPGFALGVRRRKVVLGLQGADAFGAFEPFGQHVHQCGVKVVDARPDLLEFCVRLIRWVHSRRFYVVPVGFVAGRTHQ